MRPGVWRAAGGAVGGGAGGDEGACGGRSCSCSCASTGMSCSTTLPGGAGGGYTDSPEGQPPVSPGAAGVGDDPASLHGRRDDEVVEATVMDRRWQWSWTVWMSTPPFSKGTLVGFRQRLMAKTWTGA